MIIGDAVDVVDKAAIVSRNCVECLPVLKVFTELDRIESESNSVSIDFDGPVRQLRHGSNHRIDSGGQLRQHDVIAVTPGIADAEQACIDPKIGPLWQSR